MGAKKFGARVERFEDEKLLTGRGRYVDDIHRPGMLQAAFLRSPHGHARFSRIDVAPALEMPGVHAVFIASDLPGRMAKEPIPLLVPNPLLQARPTQHSLAVDEVCYVGQAIAVVIADTRYQAEDALAVIEVDYDPLPAVSDVRAAVGPAAVRAHADLDSNVIASFPMQSGDVDAAFANAPHVFKEGLWQHRGGGMAMETRGIVAEYDVMSDLLTVWTASQTPHVARRLLADLLERNVDAIRVAAPDVGGGFGPKAIFYPEEAVIAACALMMRRPIKWIEDRREHFLCATQERDQYWDMEIACDGTGKILGVRGSLLHDSGAFVPWGIIMPYIAATTVPGPYVLPAYRLDVTVALTNKVATTPVRGAGRPQAVFAMERLLDRAAAELGIDRAEIRRRNFIQPEQMPFAVGLVFRDGKPLVYDSGDYPKGQAAAVELADYDGFEKRREEARTQSRYIGIGIANYVEGTGLGPYEGVTVRIQQDGKVMVGSGATSQGQGTATTLAQIVADEIGCDIADVVVTLGDTAVIANGVGAFASRLAVNAGNSASAAGKVVRRQVIEIASRALNVDVDQIEIEDSRAISRVGNKESIGFGELARIAQGMPGFSFEEGHPVGLEHTAYFTPSQASYCSGTHICEVEVDIDTGGVRILRYTVAHDSGNIINPLVVDGQVQGGVAHGIGNALLEWMKYDENAQPVTTTFADYLLPMATDVPTCAIAHVETPTPLNPLGVKGAGEGGTIPAAAAIISAIEDALSPFGIHASETPLTPNRIVEQLTQAGAYSWKNRA